MTSRASRSRSHDDAQREHWNRLAAGWERWEPVLMHGLGAVNPVLLRALRLEPGHRVIDFGCGTGDPALAIAQWVGPRGRVVGIDVSEAMLAVARRRARVQRLAHVRFRRADMARFVQRGRRFDRAVCRYGLMFASDPLAALEAMRRCLERGGRLVVSVWGPLEGNPGQRLRDEAERPFRKPPPDPENAPSPMRLGRAGVLPRLLRAAGYRNVRVEAVDVGAVYGSIDDYVRVQCDTALAETFRSLRPADRRRLCRRLRVRFRRFVAGDVVRIPARAWVASGERA